MIGDVTVVESSMSAAVITGSIREGRFGPTAAGWFVTQAEPRSDMVLDVIDLADLDLPAAYPQRRCAPPGRPAPTPPDRRSP
jgi:hypothetical protein